VKRKCREFTIRGFLDELRVPNYMNIKFYIDLENSSEILSFLKKQSIRKRFKLIIYSIVTGTNNSTLYGGEAVSPKTKSITAMKFNDARNIRVYCKEISLNGKKIIMISAYSKKANTVQDDKKIKTLIETISEYEYDFQKENK
jgi:hypothetical protein